MSLLKKIQDDQDKRLIASSASSLELERSRSEQTQQLESIIRDALQKLADSLGEELKVIDAGYYYQIGDILLLVELFQSQHVLPNPSNPNLVVTEYLVWLIGIDKRSDRLDKLRQGTLQFVTYDSLYRTITSSPSYLNLNASDVLKQRRDLERFK